jgi:hypothetical protein
MQIITEPTLEGHSPMIKTILADQWIKIRMPKFAPPPPPTPPPPSESYMAEADLQPGQIQDLAEGMGALLLLMKLRQIKDLN